MNLATTGPDLMSSIQIQDAHWSGKSQGNLIFLQGQGKVREFCEMVREILSTKKVRENSGKFKFWPKLVRLWQVFYPF